MPCARFIKRFRFSNSRRPAQGFTLIEILVVMAIIAILAGLSFAVYSYAIKGTRKAATEELINRLGKALLNYRQTTGNQTFPIRPGGNAEIFRGDDPGYYTMACAPLGSHSSGDESNKDLIAHLIKAKKFLAESNRMRKGELVDHFGHPIVVRFLRKLRHPKDPDGPKDEMVFIWSYGADGKNQTGATPNYEYLGHGPNEYDYEEIERIEASDENADDVRVWFR